MFSSADGKLERGEFLDHQPSRVRGERSADETLAGIAVGAGVVGLGALGPGEQTFAFMRAEIQSDVQVCSNFDERFDTFWEELKRAYPERFLATRSREVLQWHFKYALARDKVWIVTAGDSRINAYAIFSREDNAVGSTRVRLADFQSLSPDSETLIPMLAWAFRRCQEEGIHMLEAFGFRPEKQQVIDSLRPYRRRLASWYYFYRARDKALGPVG